MLAGSTTRLFEFSQWKELRPERATFHQVALTAQAHVGPLLQERDVRLTIDDRSGDMVANLDRDEVADALAELITNAVHHSAPGSEVILRAEALPPSDGRRRGLQIQVIDRGRGMVPAECSKAFNLFFSRRPDGAGMGLAIVRRTIEGHGGEVTLTSELGSGTTVTIRLPEDGPSRGDVIQQAESQSTPE